MIRRSSLNTIKAYREDVYATELTAIVTDISFIDGVTSIVLDRTVFYPTGGGQPCDKGFIEDFFIFDVSEDKDGTIIHKTKDITSSESASDLLGTEISMRIDWDIRFRNMQRHLGEHLLSGAFYKLFGAKNKGFHMGEDYITIDILTDFGLLTPEMVNEAEILANKFIQRNLPVKVSYFKSGDKASELPVRKPITIDGEVSIVTAGYEDNIADCVACCGTHPSHTGEVGLLKIYKFETNKGMTRIYFDVGMDALNKCINDMAELKKISEHYSCGEYDLYDVLIRKEELEKKLKNSISKLQTSLVNMKVSEIYSDIVDKDYKGLYRIDESLIDSDGALKMGYKIIDQLSNYKHIDSLILAIITEGCNIILLSNGTFPCGKLVKNNVKNFNGKGGGRDNNARAKFDNSNSINAFLDKIELEINH